MAEETATFALRIDADAEPAKESAAALEKFRSAIQRSQENVTAYRKSLSMLKGSSDEVADAKTKLKAALEAEKAAITKNNLEILKLGGSYDKLQKTNKKNVDTFAASKKAIQATGGPIKDLNDKLSSMRSILGEVKSGWGLFALGVVAGTTAVVAAAAAIAGLLTTFNDWILKNADALRNMQLLREAFSGSAKNATSWGHQIDWLSLRVATSKDKLNEMAIAVEKSLRGTRVSGQGMVDIWKSVAVASASMGEETGRALQGIAERGKLTGRFGIDFKAPGISELQGLGVTFQEISKQLAKDLGIGLDQAQIALRSHTVTMDAGAKALREVVEARFGELNASIEGITTKLKDNIRDWTQEIAQAGGPLEPLLASFKSLVDLTGLQSEHGQAMKRAVTEYATRFASFLSTNMPMFKEMAMTTLTLASWLIRAGAAVFGFLSHGPGLFLLKTTLVSIGAAVGVLAGVITLAAGAFALLVGGPIAAFSGMVVGIIAAVKAIAKIDWSSVGRSILEGLKRGILSGWTELKTAITGIGEGIKESFKSALGIGSPSRVFAEYGKMTSAGYVQGVERSQSTTQAATSSMVTTPREAQSSAPAAGPAGNFAINVEFNISGAGAERTAQLLQSGSVLDGISYAIRSALRSAGIPTGTPSSSGG